MYGTDDIEKVLIDEKELSEKVAELAKKISNDYNGEPVLIVTVLKGGVVFAVDLMRQLAMPVELDFLITSSYGASSKSTGVVKIIKDLDCDIMGKNVLIVEDIIDTGITLTYLKDLLLSRNPKSLKICTILDKPSRRQKHVDIDYTGFDIPDEFVIGYGLDYAGKYRNLPFVGILKRSVYQK